MTVDTAGSGVPPRSGAAARLRLVRRAASVLLPLESAEVTADVENKPVRAADIGPRLLRTDLLISASDLRVRVALLPGRDATVFAEEIVLSAALVMLLENPDTSAVVVVVDDQDLTAKLIEPSDGPNSVQASVDATTDEPGDRFGPLDRVVRTYLRQVTPHWEDVPPLASSHEDFRADARSIAASALTNLQAGQKNTPEWRAARTSLSTSDADWAASLAIRLRLDVGTDVASRLEAQARGGGSA